MGLTELLGWGFRPAMVLATPTLEGADPQSRPVSVLVCIFVVLFVYMIVSEYAPHFRVRYILPLLVTC